MTVDLQNPIQAIFLQFRLQSPLVPSHGIKPNEDKDGLEKNKR